MYKRIVLCFFSSLSASEMITVHIQGHNAQECSRAFRQYALVCRNFLKSAEELWVQKKKLYEQVCEGHPNVSRSTRTYYAELRLFKKLHDLYIAAFINIFPDHIDQISLDEAANEKASAFLEKKREEEKKAQCCAKNCAIL